jgi:hypothetical protein
VVTVTVTPPLGTPPCQTLTLKWPDNPGALEILRGHFGMRRRGKTRAVRAGEFQPGYVMSLQDEQRE